MRDRDLYAPDIAKAFAILLVVFGHVLIGLFTAGLIEKTPFWMAVHDGIYLFHMPLFFYLSGLFFEKSLSRYGYKGLVKKNVLTLLCPLVVWSYIQTSLQYLAGANANNRPDLQQVFMAPVPPQQQFWFLGALFVIIAVVGLVYKTRSPRQYIYGLLALFLFNFAFWNAMIDMMRTDKFVFFLGQIILHIPYFVMGIVLGQEKIGSLRLHPIICVLLFALAIYAYLVETVLPSLVLGACSILCIITVYKMAEHIAEFLSKHSAGVLKAICFVGMNTMIIYLAHIIVAGAVRAILLKTGIIDSAAHLFLATAAGVMLPLLAVPVGLCLQKYWPKFTGAVLPVRIERKIA